jgi:hypothetical protein
MRCCIKENLAAAEVLSHLVKTTICQCAILPICHFVNMPSCQLDIMGGGGEASRQCNLVLLKS